METEIKNCRVCRCSDLEPVISLGKQAMTGIFPKEKHADVPIGTLELVRCADSCGLVQSKYSFDRAMMYGEGYGYESGINETMRDHLKSKIERLKQFVFLNDGDLVVDIGSNDGTLLKFYYDKLLRVGVDPSAERFRDSYRENGITLFSDFFEDIELNEPVIKKAKAITSIAMFYDVEAPLYFMMDIKKTLDKDGVWMTEQSYMPLMLARNSYDTICHEHVEYYSLTQIKWMADQVGLKIIDVAFNNINGGSFEVILAHEDSNLKPNTDKIIQVLGFETQFSYQQPFEKFRTNVEFNRASLVQQLRIIDSQCLKVYGYGASTKGNVILQYCGLTGMEIPYIADRNPAKCGRYTPYSNIPIISEESARTKRPDFFLVFPWHFKAEIMKREHQFLVDGGGLIFPLPNLRIERIKNA